VGAEYIGTLEISRLDPNNKQLGNNVCTLDTAEHGNTLLGLENSGA
jgi:hypothetical protein